MYIQTSINWSLKILSFSPLISYNVLVYPLNLTSSALQTKKKTVILAKYFGHMNDQFTEIPMLLHIKKVNILMTAYHILYIYMSSCLQTCQHQTVR
jgi:hypothetical protein